MANLIVAQLLYLDSVDQSRDVTMYINSPGGSITAGMAIFDTMRHVRPDVSTICVSMAASMGAFLLASGQMGKRYELGRGGSCGLVALVVLSYWKCSSRGHTCLLMDMHVHMCMRCGSDVCLLLAVFDKGSLTTD